MVQQSSLLVNPVEPNELDEKLRLIPQDDEDQGINCVVWKAGLPSYLVILFCT